ncbi:MAG: methanogenesis marker 16 metalloprotein [Methanomicrobiales archaeon]
MNIRSIEEINHKISKGEATVLTAEEVSNLVSEGHPPKADEIDVVTTGTCGIMSGTAAIFHINVSEPGQFKKTDKILLNGVPGYPGPCPNEWLGSVDLIVYGTSHSIYDSQYGGGFLFKDIIAGKDVHIELKSIEGKSFETTTNISEISTAKLIGTRMAFKNYTAFVNPSNKSVKSIFNAIEMEGPFKGISFSGCGQLNPIQNDPKMKTICMGTNILLNDSKGIVIGNGTRSTPEKPNLMVSADMHDMDPHFIGGYKTAAGPEIFNSLALAIPVLNEEILKYSYILNEDIKLPIADIRGRHNVLTSTSYANVWNKVDERPAYHPENCKDCFVCLVRQRCPTLAYKENLDKKRCFGCGMCAYSCPHGVFTMNTGNVEFEIDDKIIKTLVACRQSDIKRAREITSKLKKMIKNGDFTIQDCK